MTTLERILDKLNTNKINSRDILIKFVKHQHDIIAKTSNYSISYTVPEDYKVIESWPQQICNAVLHQLCKNVFDNKKKINPNPLDPDVGVFCIHGYSVLNIPNFCEGSCEYGNRHGWCGLDDYTTWHYVKELFEDELLKLEDFQYQKVLKELILGGE